MGTNQQNTTRAPKRGRATRFLVMALFVCVLGGGLLTWIEWSTFWTWYDLRGLAAASDRDRERWIERIVALDEAAVPGLVEMTAHASPEAATNARAALLAMTQHWGPAETRSVKLFQRLTHDYPTSGSQGRFAALALAKDTCAKVESAPFGRDLLAVVRADEEPLVLEAALELAAVVVGHKQPGVADSVKKLVAAGLHASDAGLRIKSIHLAHRPGVEMLEAVSELLNDPVAEVRCAVLVAVGPAADVVLDETLLPCLRDTDPEVRRLCEQALRARGLSEDHLRLSRFLIDPAPSERLKVLDHLGDSADLEPGVWLRRLSHDPAPSVRASAVRVMAQQNFVDMSDRLDQMARTDPSPSVSYLASFYMKNAMARPVR